VINETVPKLLTAFQSVCPDENADAEAVADWLWLAAHSIPSRKWHHDELLPQKYDSLDHKQVEQSDFGQQLESEATNRTSDSDHLEDITSHSEGDPEPDQSENLQKSSTPLYSRGQGTGTGSGLPLRVPGGRALPHSLALVRALRPLKQQVETNDSWVIDEEATVRRIADTGIWIPVLKANRQRWLELALVLDESPSMRLWHNTIKELRALLVQLGAFRDIRIWKLKTSGKDQRVDLHSGEGETACYFRGLVNTARPRLIVIVSDFISPAWQGEELIEWLNVWGREHPVNLIQLLPQRLWRQSCLRTSRLLKVTSSAAGVPNSRLHFRQPTLPWAEPVTKKTIAFPLISLEPDLLADWAYFIVGSKKIELPAFQLQPIDQPIVIAPKNQSEENERLQQFRAAASPIAYKLACFLAAAPLMLPVMRLVQRVLVPESGQSHLAEFFLSGLIKRVNTDEDIIDPDKIVYDFLSDNLRNTLLESGLITDAVRVQEEVSRFINEHYDDAFSFQAIISDPKRTGNVYVSEKLRPFANVTASVLEQLGGEYAEVAQNFIGLQRKGQQTSKPVRSSRKKKKKSGIQQQTRLGIATFPSLDASLVRILIDNQEPRRPEGAGFLVTPQHILTCVHVVNTALGRNLNAADQPSPASEVFLDFPLLNNHCLLRAKILHWFPVADDSATGTTGTLEDIAVLELLPETPLPAEAWPAPLVVLDSAASFTDHRLRMCGFPGGVDQGTYIDGMLKGRIGAGSWEIHPLDKNRPIEQGFSGTAVWAVQENAVCGMINSRLRRKPDQGNGPVITGYMLPASALIRAFPELDQHSRPANPYRGLEAFREKDADLYFGRGQTIARLQQVVAEQPFAAVIGASGSGKSSVVFAGLLPALRKNGDWLIAHCRPKKQPFYELAACLIPLLYDDPILRSEKTDELKEKLHAGSVELTGVIRLLREKHGNRRFLLIVDQFEELFTLNVDRALIRQYIGILLECLPTEHFTVLLTMRADSFATAVGFTPLAEALNSSAPIILSQIDDQGLREVVEQPAKLLGVYFEPGLANLIVSDVGKEPGSLPLLEFCLTQLWERQEFHQISHDAYTAIGGVQQALANHANAVYAEFDEEEREQVRHIFLKLVRPGQGTEDTRQVAMIRQIPAEYRGLITRLADKRLIVTGRDEESGKETVEIVHEALIRRWQTLRQWIDEERKFLVWQGKIKVMSGQWEEAGRDEGALLRGFPLDEALRWIETHTIHLTHRERHFIEISKQLRQNERKARKTKQTTGLSWLGRYKEQWFGKKKKKIILIGVNSSDTSLLRLDRELHEVTTGLATQKNLRIDQGVARTSNDLMQMVTKESPYIVHFLGPGKNKGIYLENEYGEAKLVSAAALAGLFKLVKDTVQCVVISSEMQAQAQAIKRHIPYVIRISPSVSDTTAISFSRGFYTAIGAGKDIPLAYEFGKTAIQLKGDSDEEIQLLS